MGRRIHKAKIKFISLCKRGMNQFQTIYKSDDYSEFATILKDDLDEKGELTCVVYAPETPDAEGDIASAEVIKDMAYEFQRDGGQIDVKHDCNALSKNEAYVAQNFIIQKGDPRFTDMTNYQGKPVDVTGGWGVVLKIEDPVLRQKFRDKEWNGVSMFGPAELTREDTSLYAKALNKTNSTKEQEDMDAKEMQTLLDKQATVLVTGIAKAVAEAIKPADPKPEPKTEETMVKFEGDPSDAEAVKAHLVKVAAAAVDWNDPKSVSAHLAKLEKAEEDDDKKEETDPVKAEVAKLQKQIKKLQGASNQVPGNKVPDASELEKQFAEGLLIAKAGGCQIEEGHLVKGFLTS